MTSPFYVFVHFTQFLALFFNPISLAPPSGDGRGADAWRGQGARDLERQPHPRLRPPRPQPQLQVQGIHQQQQPDQGILQVGISNYFFYKKMFFCIEQFFIAGTRFCSGIISSGSFFVDYKGIKVSLYIYSLLEKKS